MPQSAEDAVAAVEQCRTEAWLAADINALDEMIDEQGATLKIYSARRTTYARPTRTRSM